MPNPESPTPESIGGHWSKQKVHEAYMPEGWEDSAAPSLDNPVVARDPLALDPKSSEGLTTVDAERVHLSSAVTVTRDRNDLTGFGRPQGVDSRYMRILNRQEPLHKSKHTYRDAEETPPSNP